MVSSSAKVTTISSVNFVILYSGCPSRGMESGNSPLGSIMNDVVLLSEINGLPFRWDLVYQKGPTDGQWGQEGAISPGFVDLGKGQRVGKATFACSLDMPEGSSCIL